jgi:predicted nuclease of predicted toxin-antitoxin system
MAYLPLSHDSKRYSSIRLLWDENLTPRVPRALRELGLNTSHVGHKVDGSPDRGSSDSEIIEYSLRTNQIIVTSNHDMMLLCAEAGQRFVWLDPRGSHLSGIDQTLLVLRQVQEWESILSNDATSCVRAMRTKCSRIEPAEAARLAGQRMKALQKRKRTKRPSPLGPMVSEEF